MIRTTDIKEEGYSQYGEILGGVFSIWRDRKEGYSQYGEVGRRGILNLAR